jgi:hypothetical protein
METDPLFEHDAGNALLPGFPAPLRRYAVARVARRLRSYLRPVGVRAEQYALLMRWTDRMLDLLETHFSQHRYSMGDRRHSPIFLWLRPCTATWGVIRGRLAS